MLAERQLASQTEFFRALILGTPGGSILERPGLLAFRMPSAPDASIVNGVVYRDADAVAAAREELAGWYGEAGVRAWTVWVRPGDEALGRTLAQAGHVRDATPALMAARIDELDLSPRAALDLHAEATWPLVGRLNDQAYGLVRQFEDVFERAELPSLRRYVARLAGEDAACVVASHHEGDCGIYLVATAPAAQRRGLCSELVRHALTEARGLGCETSSLEATKAGAPVYERLGYRLLGTLEMWEHRVPAPAS